MLTQYISHSVCRYKCTIHYSVVLHVLIISCVFLGLLFMRRRNRRRRDREPQDIPMNRQGTPQASNHTAVEETGGELQVSA